MEVRRKGLAFAVATLVLLAPASARAARLTVGVVMPDVVAPASTYAALADHGVKVVRTFLTMPDVEPSRGNFSSGWLNAYDQWVSHVTAIGAKPVIDVVGAAAWASGSSDPHELPSDPRAFADFAQAYASFAATLARRYAGRVAAWEVWNEEDTSAWWTGGGDPARYASLLKSVYPAIKAADPATTVVLGGLTGNDYRFLSAVYDHGGGSSFDAVGVHTDTACNIVSPYRYLRDPNGMIDQWSFLGYRSVQSVMAAHGQAAKPIWMTELGWSTFSGICSSGMWAGKKAGGVSELDQATFLTQALHCLTLDSSVVPVGLVYALADGRFSRQYGLERADGSAKPAYAALGAFDRSGDQLSGGCGNFSGPSIAVTTPASGAGYTGQLPVTVRATIAPGARQASADAGLGVARISLFYDGSHHIRNFTDRRAPATLAGEMVWNGAQRLPPGRHTLTFVAYDSEGNRTSTTISIVHVGSPHGVGRSPVTRRSHGRKAHGRKAHGHKAHGHKVPKLHKRKG